MARKYSGERRFIDSREADSYIHIKTDWPGHFSVRLADCNRVIELSFPAATRSERKRSLAKLNRVIGALERLRAEVERLRE